MLFILTVHSYSSLHFSCNLSYRLTELNISFFSHKTDFIQKYLMNTTWRHVNAQATKLDFIHQICLQNFLIKQDHI